MAVVDDRPESVYWMKGGFECCGGGSWNACRRSDFSKEALMFKA